jgi:trimeric autotransporter adhesin
MGKGSLGLQVTAPGTNAAILAIASAPKGGTSGVVGISSDPGGNGVFGISKATSGGIGTIGRSSASSGHSIGVLGRAVSTTDGAAGVAGSEPATSGQVFGVTGTTNSTTNGASGVNGFDLATSGQVWGVGGGTYSTTGGAAGVQGYEYATSGAVYGVSGGTASTTDFAAGVFGSEPATSGLVYGVNGGAASTSNGAAGVNGVEFATSGNVFGVSGATSSTTGAGVAGFGNATSGFAVGVFGQTQSPAGSGGVFTNLAGGNGLVLIGEGANLAQIFTVDASGNGNFAGNLNVTGKLTKGSGSFKIDHPLDPANKYLSHSFVESPDMMNVYNGNITTDRHGLATVLLPDYFEALNGDFRYQLTVIGQFAQAIVAKKIASNHLVIRTNKPGVEVSWQVTGIRHDAYANAYRIPTEEDKPAAEQGYYLHPEVFGQPASKSIQAASQKAAAIDQLARLSNP